METSISIYIAQPVQQGRSSMVDIEPIKKSVLQAGNSDHRAALDLNQSLTIVPWSFCLCLSKSIFPCKAAFLASNGFLRSSSTATCSSTVASRYSCCCCILISQRTFFGCIGFQFFVRKKKSNSNVRQAARTSRILS